MSNGLSREAKFRIYLFVLSVIGLVLILLTTSKYGAGVSADAGRNLSTADNLLASKGFVDFSGAPFVLWPPLYPLVIAGLSLLTKWDTFQAAWYLNVCLYVVNLWLSGWFLYVIFKDRPAYAVIGALMLLLSRSTLRIYANVASEPLFGTFLLIFLFAAAGYLQSATLRDLWLIFIMAGLATLQRYLGVVLIGVGGLVVLAKSGWRGLLRALPLLLVAVLPVGAWAVLHNLPLSGGLFGPREFGTMLPLQNIGLSLTKILWWFVPRLSFLDPLLLRPWIVLVVIILILSLINRKADWVNWLKALSNVYVWPALVFSVVYFFLLAFTVVTADHLDLTSDRYYVIILPFVLMLLFITLDQLVLNHLNLGNRFVRYGLTALMAVWFIYPVNSLQEYVRLALVIGEPSNYNVANSARFLELDVVKAARSHLEKDPSATVYSNYLNVVWFIYHHPVRALPFVDTSLPRDQQLVALRQNYPDWPPQSGYIIWFTPNQYHFYAAPDELSTIADLTLLYQDKNGEIYYVHAR
jgi:hypothetical protein